MGKKLSMIKTPEEVVEEAVIKPKMSGVKLVLTIIGIAIMALFRFIPPAGPIREGGGISGMRRRVRQLGGRMELYTVPRFRIELSVPKEAVEK